MLRWNSNPQPPAFQPVVLPKEPLEAVQLASFKSHKLTKIYNYIVTFGFKTLLHVLGEHDSMKLELYRTNAKIQALVPALLQ